VLHLHIAKREGQCIYGSVDLGKERLLIVFIHFLEVNTCLMTKDEKRRVWNENVKIFILIITWILKQMS